MTKITFFGPSGLSSDNLILTAVAMILTRLKILFRTIITSVPPILPKFSDQKMGSRRVVGWYKKPENYFGFILPIKPRSP